MNRLHRVSARRHQVRLKDARKELIENITCQHVVDQILGALAQHHNRAIWFRTRRKPRGAK